MHTFLSLFGSTLYLAAAALILLNLKRQSVGQAPQRKWLLVTWSGGIILHAFTIYPRIVSSEGLNLGFSNALSLVAFLLVTGLFISASRKPAEVLGAIVLPLAFASILFDQFIPSQAITATAGQPGIQFHILVSFLAYAVLMLAALQAIILAIQDHHLHRHHPGGMIRALPALRDMESLLFQLIAIGLVLLSLALLSGFVFLEDLFAQHLAHKTVLSLIAWAIFAILLWGRWRFVWRGRRALRWTLGGFFALMLAYFGTKLVLELILQRATT